ncbi:MAG: L(+)-tartrate dehydratase subunit beta [Oscillospiraceae bacterium]|nr:L(+)-tartrate dehydratase subunit beta [Oscillospiraceae bacterium]MBR2806077.1 L(+)-tartrate dehydratase subunit beta [Oscillospiraceae bacterium]
MKKVLTTPIKAEDLEDIHIGDIVYLTGTLVTGRDDVHRRVVHEGMTSPYDFNGGAIFHAGPIVHEEPGNNTLISVGPTSSIRMEQDEEDFIRMTGVKMLVGKGGMGPKTTAACEKYKAIHCVFVGGCAVSAAVHVEKIEDCFWRELGMPECEWVFKVNEFGPLIVSIDTHGGNLFVENKAKYQARKEECEAPIIESVKDYLVIE